MDKEIALIRPCSWEEVFLTWYHNEGDKQHWIDLAKSRGFASWAEWRLSGYAHPFECEKAEWGLYEITNPSEVISTWYGGPFRTMIERHYQGDKTRRFSQLAKQADILENQTVIEMVENYPQDTVISALQLSDGSIVVIEGNHRCYALAVMAAQKKPFQGTLTFAIGKSTLSELPIVGQNTAS